MKEIRERGSFPRTGTRVVESKAPTDFVHLWAGEV